MVMVTYNPPFDSIYPSLSWTGTEFGVTWQDSRDNNYEIYFNHRLAFLSPDDVEVVSSPGH